MGIWARTHLALNSEPEASSGSNDGNLGVPSLQDTSEDTKVCSVELEAVKLALILKRAHLEWQYAYICTDCALDHELSRLIGVTAAFFSL